MRVHAIAATSEFTPAQVFTVNVTDNWQRDQGEIDAVMTAFQEILDKNTPTFRKWLPIDIRTELEF